MTNTARRTIVRVICGPFTGQYGTVTDTLDRGTTWVRVQLQSNVATVLRPSDLVGYQR